WPWLEDVVAYENARPCEALIVGGLAGGDDEAVRIGAALLRWLDRVQRSECDWFRPIGCRGFFPRGGEPAAFDQQPIESQAMLSAALAALRATGDETWLDAAWRAFDWFHGRNDLGIRVYDATTGGCRDGLLEDRVNENQGAESTLAHLQALVDLLAAGARQAGDKPGATGAAARGAVASGRLSAR
ncbi:MAG: hypothetical protein ACKOCX_12570, partial [Planctomycetota bacterium]